MNGIVIIGRFSSFCEVIIIINRHLYSISTTTTSAAEVLLLQARWPLGAPPS